MPRDRLRSNVQIRTAGIDPSMGLIVGGLIVSAVVLLTMLGAQSGNRKPTGARETGRPAATSDFGS